MPPAPITPTAIPEIKTGPGAGAGCVGLGIIILAIMAIIGAFLPDDTPSTPTKTPYEQLQEDTACKTPQSHACFDSDGNWRYSFNN